MAQNTSVVDWLKANGADSSFQNRAKMAQQYGVSNEANYRGSYEQNTSLLNAFKQNGLNGGVSAPQQPQPQQKAPTQTASKWYNGTPDDVAQWYFGYSDKLKTGKATESEYKKYLDITNKYGLKKYGANEATLLELSRKALSGDKWAKDYLYATQQKALTGKDLWKNVDPTKGFRSNDELRAYLNEMSDSEWSKKYDDEAYNKYNEAISGNKAMEDWEVQLYNEIIGRRNLDDYNNPYVQAAGQLEKDKKNALNAQDVALNQGMAQMDANSFQQFEQLQQNMSQRGMEDSGIGADAYMRAQMANNQNYQQAFAQGALNKSQMETQYNEAISNAKLGKFDYQNKLDQAQAEQAIKLQEIQNDQDKWLTESTGSVFINGQRIMVNGKPLTTVEWEKLSEDKRHNLAQEAIDSQKNEWDYQLGKEDNAIGWDSNAIKRQQIAVDLQIATSKLQLDYASLDYNYAKLESNNAIAQDKIALAAENAQTAADKSKITALGQQLSSLTQQIVAAQKAGKKPDAELVKQYNNVAGQLQALAGNF